MSQHNFFMSKALKLAAQGLYTTHPNPRVGCVLVKGDQIIAEGWHEKAGSCHAEINALNQSFENSHGATCYVTLEPCCHHGRTGPCVDALIQAGIKKVIAAMPDPNPLVSGKGFERLRESGISVDVGVLEQEARDLNPGFIKRMEKGLPFVRAKLAMSLDGRTALASGESKWITGEMAREDGYRLRAQSSAILTGIGTILADNPLLNVRLANVRYQPKLVIIDTHLRTPITAKILQPERDVWIATCSNNDKKIAVFEKIGVKVLKLPLTNQHVDLAVLLKILGQQECNELHVEAGPILTGFLVQAQLLDEFVIYIAPKFLGDSARALLTFPTLLNLEEKFNLKFFSHEICGDDIKLILRR